MTYFKALLRILNHPLNKDQQLKTLYRIVWWKINQLFFKLPTIIHLAQNIRCICYPDSSFGGLIVYTTLPEYSEMKLFMEKLKPSSQIVDIGANIGIYSLLAGSVIKTGKVYAFEPSAEARDRLLENVSINKLNNLVTVYPHVVSDHTGSEDFVLTNSSEINHIAGDTSEDVNNISLSAVTLDDFVKEHKIKQIDILKVDVEGAEGKVLAGAKTSLLTHKIKMIFMEVNPKSQLYGMASDQLIKILRNNKYQIYLNNNDTWKSFSGRLQITETINIVALAPNIKL